MSGMYLFSTVQIDMFNKSFVCLIGGILIESSIHEPDSTDLDSMESGLTRKPLLICRKTGGAMVGIF